MAYVGFDLDETLGRFSAPYYYTMFLQPHSVVYRGSSSGMYNYRTRFNEPIPLSPALESKLEEAFTRFAHCLATKEPALGLLRPSMIQIARRLYELKQEGLVKAVLVYSNNGNLALLHLAGKMIEKLADAPGLFCNYIHWYHPSRSGEIDKWNPGVGQKTLAVLKQAFQAGSCGFQEEIPTKDIYFFDDAVPTHWDLQSKLGDRYFRILPYKYDADFSILDECFERVINESGLLDDVEYKQYVAPLVRNNVTLQGMMQIINQDKASFARKFIKPDDSVLLQRVFTVFPKPISRNAFTKSLQTLRRLEKKQNQGSNLTANEQQAIQTSRNTITAYEAQHPNVSEGGARKKRKTRRSSRRYMKRTRRNH